jgi:carboxypeptidase C (cathepsin A)
MDAAGEQPETDPADTAIRGAFTAAFNDYIVRELNYTSDVPYATSANGANRDWDWKHALRGQMRPAPLPITVPDLSEAMRTNPHLKVMSANGWFDLATPFFATEYDLAHMDIDPKLRSNLTFTYYPSGHMVYLNLEAAKQFKADLAKFYDSATAR